MPRRAGEPRKDGSGQGQPGRPGRSEVGPNRRGATTPGDALRGLRSGLADLARMTADRAERAALLLQQGSIFGFLTGFRPFAAHAQQIKLGRVSAAHEPHQIRRREKDIAAKFPHGFLQSNMSATQSGIVSELHLVQYPRWVSTTVTHDIARHGMRRSITPISS